METKNQKSGITSFEEAQKRLQELGILGRDGKPTYTVNLKEGQKAYMDVDKITGRKHYPEMAEDYREFVESCRGVPLTIHLEKARLVSVIENPKWYFWDDDFTAIENDGGDEDGGSDSG